MNEELITSPGVAPSSANLSLGRKAVLNNFFALSFSSFIEALSGLVSSIYVRRILGVILIGQVSWAAAIVSYLVLLVNPGLDVIARREVSRRPDQARQYLVWSFFIQGLLACLGFGLAFAFSRVVPRPDIVKWLLLLQALSLFLMPLDIRWLLLASEKVPPLALMNTIMNILQIAALILFVREPAHVIRYVLLSYPFKLGVYFFTFIYAVKQKIIDWGRIELKITWGWSLILAALPIGFANFAILIYNNFDTIVLGFTRGDEAVGLYRTAYALMLAPVPLLEIMHQICFPTLSRSKDHVEIAKNISEDYLRILTWAGLSMAAMGWAIGRYVIVLLFGPQYQAAGPFFEWLSINIAFVFFNYAYNDPLRAWNQQAIAAKNNYFGSIVNVVANLILIPYIGIPGAIITTIFAEFVVMIGVIRTRKKFYPIAWLKILIPALITCVPAALIAHGLSFYIPWYLSLLAGIVLCCIGLVWFENRKIIIFYRSIVHAFAK